MKYYYFVGPCNGDTRGKRWYVLKSESFSDRLSGVFDHLSVNKGKFEGDYFSMDYFKNRREAIQKLKAAVKNLQNAGVFVVSKNYWKDDLFTSN